MESYGAGWDDDDADPPQPGPGGRLSTPLNKRIAVGTTVVVVAVGGFWVTHRGGGGVQIGDCAIDETTQFYEPNVKRAACTDPAAVYEVAARTTAMGHCPAGDYSALTAFGGNDPFSNNEGTSLCLALHVHQGECLQIHVETLTAGSGVVIPREIDCALGKGPERYRIAVVRTDTTDRDVCSKSALPFSYSTPREVICAAVLS